MSKELRAFRKICKNLNSYEFTDEYKKNKKLIETTLKNYEELTSKPVILCGRTHGYTQALIDTICKNYKEVKITNLEDEKKVKALEVIKELLKIKIGIDESENDKSCGTVFIVTDKEHIWHIYTTFNEENIQKLKLLKEVLL